MKTNLFKAAMDIIINESDEGCSGNLTVTSKSAVEHLDKAIQKARKNPMGIARSVWKCPTCGSKVRLTFAELADVGYPLCGDGCKHPTRELVEVEICGETLPVE
jgi:hypothetical protein